MKRRPFHKRLARAIRAAGREMFSRRSAFTGAEFNRLLLDWIAQAKSPDDEIRYDLKTLRARAREMARNNSLVRRYFRLLGTNVVGPMGIGLQAQVRNGSRLAAGINQKIEAGWEEFAGGAVTVDGRLTLRQFERLLIKTVACDGEAFVRIWRGFDGNRFGIAFQAIDADLVDETFNRPASLNTNEVRMGIEIDRVGAPVGYWVWNHRQGEAGIARERYRIGADEMIHLYNSDRVNQTRGVTWVHSIMVPAHMLNGYEESEAVAARVGASKMGWLVKKDDSVAGSLVNEMKAPATMEANPGTFEALPDGYEMQTWAPEHPTGQFAAFIKQMVRKIATGVDVFSNVLANDAEGVSYSSMRSFALIEHDDWRATQQDFIDTWRRPAFKAWLEACLLLGALGLPSRDPRRYQAVKHRPRGWAWIDPLKEVQAAKIAIAEGLTSRTRVLAEKGEDFDDIAEDLARELEIAQMKGISISGDATAQVIEDKPAGEEGEEAGGGNGSTPPGEEGEEDRGELAGEAAVRARQGVGAPP